MDNSISISRAFALAPRKNFLPDSVRDKADLDVPLPIGFNQTNSQPSTVYKMLKWLQVAPGDNILDVGAGSGWTTALLANLVGINGHITATEIVSELVKFGKQNCQKANLTNITYITAGDQLGYKNNAPYDRILVSASASTLPYELVNQLANNGILVVPVRNSILVIKKSSEQLVINEHAGYSFVPLIS